MKTAILFLLILLNLFSFTFKSEPPQYNYALDENKSVAEWTGSSPRTSHQGSFAVTSAGIEVVDKKIKSGTFIIPIASIQNFDLPKTIKPVLIKHLKSKDFFNLALYPEAKFVITQVKPSPETPEGAVAGANVMVTGDFTLIGQTQPLSFPARVDLQNGTLAVEATFKLDRTKWGMTYAADPKLKNRHIFPEVDIHLKISALRKEA
jgi:polyisoprenoid-binding protein YceI